MEDSNAQWDSESYTVNRYDPSRPLETVFATPDIERNVKAAIPEDGGNIPLGEKGMVENKLSINELQLYLSNQAAMLRMSMTREYEDLRVYQNEELETFIKAKEMKEPEFHKLVEDQRKRGIRVKPRLPLTIGRGSSSHILTSTSAVESPISPASGAPDLATLKNDPSLTPFIKFFLDLQVVQENWTVISRSWSNYVSILQRNLMTEAAFVKAVFQDAVRAQGGHKFPVEKAHIEATREAAKNIPDTMPILRTIVQVVLEMAEAGDLEFSTEPNEGKGETFGPKILRDVMSLERGMQNTPSTSTASDTNERKALDPRTEHR